MEDLGFNIIEIEKHDTTDIISKNINGELTVIWRDWDNIIKEPKMIYTTAVNPGETKGPHLHSKRTSYFVCVKGKVVFIIKDKNGKYHEIESSQEDAKMVCVANGTASAHVNISKKSSTILVLADVAWKPNDNEMSNVKFDDYFWKKWES
jgi:dTDP-4-dehydrorhamnose 3,5-epimerase